MNNWNSTLLNYHEKRHGQLILAVYCCFFIPAMHEPDSRASHPKHESSACTCADARTCQPHRPVAGPFHTFLGYLKSTQVIDTFQNQANNSQNGITIFTPQDDAFSSLKSPSLSNLTQDQLRSVCLFHSLPMYYSLADFKNLSQAGAVATYAGDQYTLNFTYTFGLVQLSSGWTNTKITSSVHATNPVAIYELNNVLLPEAIYGTYIPPAAAPAPSPDITPAADAPATKSNSTGSKPSANAPLTTAPTKGTLIVLIYVILYSLIA